MKTQGVSVKYFVGDGPCILQSELLLLHQASVKTLAQLRSALLAKGKFFRQEHRFRSLSGELVPIDLESCLAFHCVLRSTNCVFVVGDGDNIACDSLEVGIVLTSPNGEELAVGFVDASPRETLEQLRKRATVFLPLLAGCEFLFLNRKAWPVSTLYETRMRVHDVIDHRRSVAVAPLARLQSDVRALAGPDVATIVGSAGTLTSTDPDDASAVILRAASAPWLKSPAPQPPPQQQPPLLPTPQPAGSHSTPPMPVPSAGGLAAKRHLEQMLAGDADLTPAGRQQPAGRSAAKDMLISYVRAEAAHVAVVLKEKLTALGCSVFLDVDEIALGSDWQDALNDAVASTEIFIPLVTPRYGATQWTNREVKLADVLGKEILPISFIGDWPPRCLAIQFATTQFVPWDGAYDIESANIHLEAGRVAEEIRRKFDSNKRRAPDAQQPTNDGAAKPPSFKRKPTFLSIMSRKSIKFRQSRDSGWAADFQQQQQQQQQGHLVQPVQHQLLQRNQTPSLLANQTSLDEDEAVYKALMSNRQVVVSHHADDSAKAESLRSALARRGFKVSVFVISGSPRGSAEVPGAGGGGGGGGIGFDSSQEAAAAVGDPLSQGSGGLRRVGSRETLILGDELDTCSYSSAELTEESREGLLDFQAKADSAGAAVFLVSDSFLASRSSRNHIFYCEQRKHIIPVLCGSVQMPTWLKMLLEGNHSISSDALDWPHLVARHLDTIFDPNTMAYMHKSKALDFRIDKLAQMVKSQLPSGKWLVYVCSSKRLGNDCTDTVCRLLGEALAKLDWVALVTGSSPGASQIVSRSFCEHRASLGLPEDTWHLLHDVSAATGPPDFGKTILCGDTPAEKLQIAANVCSLCLLIEGGAKSAEEADQFMWHDKVVLPLKCLGGAAASYYGEGERRFEVPPGVSQRLWSKLAVPLDCVHYTGEHLVANVLNIIKSLRGYERRSPKVNFLCKLAQG